MVLVLVLVLAVTVDLAVVEMEQELLEDQPHQVKEMLAVLDIFLTHKLLAVAVVEQVLLVVLVVLAELTV